MRIRKLFITAVLAAMLIPQTAFAAGQTTGASTTTVSAPAVSASASSTTTPATSTATKTGSSTTVVHIPAASASGTTQQQTSQNTTQSGTVYRTSVENNIAIGQVAIELWQTESQGDKEVKASTKQMVVPGQVVSKINHIRNLGNTAWIRAKVVFNTDKEETDKLLNLSEHADEVIRLHADENWEKIGDYYYYKKPLEQGNEVIFIDGYNIPASWGDATADLTFEAKVSVDAVQTQNFTPDFKGKDPWFGTVIEQRVYEPFTITKGTSANFQVVFKNGAEGLIHVGDDFFSGFGTAMPGDVLNGKAKILNEYSEPVNIFFETTFNEGKELADVIDLEIKNGTTSIYSGKLSGALSRVSLGTYKKGDSSDLTFTLKIPSELRNQFALSKAKVTWIFSCELIEQEKPAEPAKPVPLIQIIQNNFMGGGKGGAKTGDASHMGLYAAILCIACGVLAVVVIKKKKSAKAEH